MSYLAGIIDTTDKGNISSGLTLLTNETVITLDVCSKTGTHNNSMFILEHSPDGGVTWLKSSQSTKSSVTIVIATSKVRACVVRGEGSASSANFFITAK